MADASAAEIISASAEDTPQNCHSDPQAAAQRALQDYHSDPQDALLRGLRRRNLLLPSVIEYAQAR